MAVSVRQGGLVALAALDPALRQTSMVVEDPFDRTHNVAAGVTAAQLRYMSIRMYPRSYVFTPGCNLQSLSSHAFLDPCNGQRHVP